ncbi:MAG: hypothetical protein Q7U28_17275 [Aquabacterium sp.]|nr:hypothetical protein [Aquabacterium sp.]
MNIRFPTEPTNGKQLVMAGLQRAATRTSHLSHRLTSVHALDVHSPHAIYDLGAEDIASGHGLDAATWLSLGYLVKDDQTHLAAAELQMDPDGKAVLLSSLQYGFHIEPFAKLLDLLTQQQATDPRFSEARLLRCAAVGLFALWLKCDESGSDTLYPVAPAPAGLQPNQAYTAADLLAVLMPLARRRTAPKTDGTVP